MKNFLCQVCNENLRISEGNYMLTYNINCPNNHFKQNVEFDELLSRRKVNNYLNKCKIHRLNKKIRCLECEKDICLRCLNNFHKGHKIEYLNNLKLGEDEIFKINEILKKEENIINNFIHEVLIFQEKLNSYINNLINDLKKYHQLKTILFNNSLQKNICYFDIENAKYIHKNLNKELLNLKSNFISNTKFIEKYDIFKEILQKISDRKPNSDEKSIDNNFLGLIPINNKYFINNYYHYDIKKTDIRILEKNTDIKSEPFNIIITKSLDLEIIRY